MLASKKIRDLAKTRVADLDKSSRYYLVKLKYKGIKEIELFALESISGKGVRDFGWVLLGFGDYGVGGRGGIISLDKKSAWLDGDLITSGVIPSRGIARGVHTNAAHYVPLTKYENIIVKKVTKNTLVLQDKQNHDIYTIKRGSADVNFAEIADFLQSKRHNDDTIRTTTHSPAPATESYDTFLRRAIVLVAEEQKASTALFQRKLKIGYARAAKLMGELEDLGIVSAAKGAEPRKLLVDSVDEGLAKVPKNIGLQFEVGQDESGKHFIADLSKVGHFISSGHVGSGHASFDESSFVTSLIQDYTPHELKFVMVDPKQVQLVPYEGIPYLLRPVIYTPDEARNAVNNLIGVMNERFDLFTKEGVNNIGEYNQTGIAPTLEHIVLLIPEIADLMMVDPKFYTDAFTKLSMRSKAVGIHMYLGTQRPSKDVLPDALLAHIFGRLIFATANEVDAERLLPGQSKEVMSLEKAGEVLYADLDTPATKLQANYVSDEEVMKVVESIKENK